MTLVKNVDIVAHTASPFHMSGSSWEKDYRDPAVQGTKNCLEAAAKESSELGRKGRLSCMEG